MTDKYAVISNPIGHSKSPLIHTSFAQSTGLSLSYVAIEGPLVGFRQTVLDFRASGGCGMNVTVPFKLQAFEMATDRLERDIQRNLGVRPNTSGVIAKLLVLKLLNRSFLRRQK